MLNYSYARLQTCWIHSEDLVAPVSITSVGLYVQCLDWQCISFVKVKKYSGFIPDKFGDRNSVFRYNSLKKKKCFKHTMIKFNHITGHQMLCKAKANKY